MINKHKKFLTAAVFCAIASTGFVLTASAEETMTHGPGRSRCRSR